MYKAYLTVFRTGDGELVERLDPLNLACETINGTHIGAENRSYELLNGTTVIGRMWPLALQENRVSRTHGEINFSEAVGVLTVTAKSVNPIFVKTLPLRTRATGSEQADTQPLAIMRQSSQLTPNASQESNSRLNPNTSVHSDKSSSPAIAFSALPDLSTPLTSPIKKNLHPTPKLQKKHLSDLSAIRASQQNPPPFGIAPSNTGIAGLIRVDSQIQHGGGYKIRGILEDTSSQPPSSAPAKTTNATPIASQIPTNTPGSQEAAKNILSGQSTPTQPAPSQFPSQQPYQYQDYTTKELGDLEKQTEWTFVNPKASPFVIRFGEPGILLVSFIGMFGGPQFQVHIIKVGTDSGELSEATHILSQEAAATQIVGISSPPPFDDHHFAVPSVPAPKPKTIPEKIPPASLDSPPSPAKGLATPSSHPSTPKNISSDSANDANSQQGRFKRKVVASPSTPSGQADAHLQNVDLSKLDDFDLQVTPPRKRRADDITPNPPADEPSERSMPLEEFAKEAVKTKKRQVGDLVVLDEGDETNIHRVRSGAPEVPTIIDLDQNVSTEQRKVAKGAGVLLKKRTKDGSPSRKEAAVAPAKQLFDESESSSADDDDDGEANLGSSDAEEDILEHEARIEQTSVTGSPLPSSSDQMPFFAVPESSPKKNVYQSSRMDVTEPSMPLPSLPYGDSRFMDTDEPVPQVGRVTRSRSKAMQTSPQGFPKAVSTMKGVKEMGAPSIPVEDYSHHELEQYAGENLGMGIVEGGEIPLQNIPLIQLQEEVYSEQEPQEAQYGVNGFGREAHIAASGLQEPEHGQTLRRSDTLTPSIDMTQIRVSKMIGSGSCGEVFKATWLGLDVAVKKVFRSLIHESALKEFQAECNIMKRLRHPNIVLFLGITRGSEDNAEIAKQNANAASVLSDSLMCLVTEFMPLGSLHDVIMNPNTTIDLMAILKMATDAAKGVNYMHMSSPPIIHRDLKSHNLLVGDNFVVKVTDFGLAKLTPSRDDAHNTFCGTLPWAAPEVLAGSGYTVKADVYSFAIVLWEMITRQEPYKGLNKPEIIVGVVNNALRPPLFPDMEPLVVELIQVCWAQDPEDRPDFQTIVDRLTEVTDYLCALQMERKSKQSGPLSNSSSGGELSCGSKWLLNHEPGSLDHYQQVKLAQEALMAGAQPERIILEEAMALDPGSETATATSLGSKRNGHIQNSNEEILKAHQDALEVMNSALQQGDMHSVLQAMDHVRRTADGVAQLSAQVIGSSVNGSADGPSSVSSMNTSFATRSKQVTAAQWTLDLNELTSIAKLNEEPGPSFSNRASQSLNKSHDSTSSAQSDTKQSNLALSGTTNVMPVSETENSRCSMWHGLFRGQDVLVRVWHEALEPSELREFYKQLSIMSTVKSSRVAIFFGCVLEPRLLMVTEYTPQPSLYSLMVADATTVRFGWDIVIILALDIALAISSLHLWKPAIVHRDIQSSKFVVDQRTWTVKMNDLGLARFDSASNHSTLAKMRGNFIYTAPETYSGAPYSTQSDVYSFGIVLWELVTRCILGHYAQPFAEYQNIRFEFQLGIQVSKEAIRPTFHPETPPPLSQLIQACWNQDPTLRPPIQEVVSQLQHMKELYDQEVQKPSNATS